MTRTLIAVAAVLLAGSALAVAQGSIRSDGRYLVSEVEDGILRVDRESGLVSICRERRREWRCELVPDDRQALESEIYRLRDENRRLRRRLTDVDPEGSRRFGYDRQPEYDDLGEPGLMTKKEVDEAMDTLEYMMKRFMGAADRLREDVAPR